jgi:agmatinase
MGKLMNYEEAMARLAQDIPPAEDAGFLGIDLDPKHAKLVLIPVPWDTTTSYRQGTAFGPGAILKASHQVDLEDGSFGQICRGGIAMLPEPRELRVLNTKARPVVDGIIGTLSEGGEPKEADLKWVNEACGKVNAWVRKVSEEHLNAGRLVGVVGGDHACPLGLIEALNEREKGGFGILHFDAHHDLRKAYEGFEFSHASIHWNSMERCQNVTKLVQVGIRDFSSDEKQYMKELGKRGVTFYQRDLAQARAEGEPWSKTVDRIIAELPQRVYVSFDVDALDPTYCPSTGTPVPGGLGFDETVYFIERLAASGKVIIGFDLCEVAPGAEGNEWDANVGARMVHKLCGLMLRTARLI